MRNLKKILALVLALVMSLSLMATAGAKDFTDKSAIEATGYQTAVDVLAELEVIRGYSDGSYQPNGDITRAEVAAIIYRIATKDVKDTQASIYTSWNKFSDVKDADWYAGYVNYCANAEIVKGNPDGTFNPNGKVTGYQVLAMILRTMGYGKNGEFVGSNWAINTAARAKQIGLIDNILEQKLGANATRGMVSEILFRALLTDCVDYNALTGYQPNGKTLGQTQFGLEKVTGVVMANEYADLEDEYTLSKGKTRLNVDGKDYVLNVTTDLTDIGESRTAYVRKTSQNRFDLLVDKLYDAGNTVAENNGDALSNNGIKSLAKDKGMDITGAEHFVNFGYETVGESDFRIEYQVEFDNDKVTDDLTAQQWFKAEYDVDPANVLKASNRLDKIDQVGNVFTYTRVIPMGNTITADDIAIMKGIFSAASDENHFSVEKVGVSGYVYAGTAAGKDQHDLSSEMSWRAFYADYILSKTDTTVKGTNAGDWLKIIDNNGDGMADYVFKTVYCMSRVLSENTKNDYFTIGYYGEGDKLNVCIGKDDSVNYLDEVAVGDVVLAALIDNKWQVEKAPEEIKVIQTISYRDKTVTTTEGDVYDQTGIDLHHDLAQDILEMANKVEYTIYFDHFGYVGAYTTGSSETHYALLTELYYNTDRNGKYLKDKDTIVEIKMGEEDLDEKFVTNMTSKLADGAYWFEGTVIGTDHLQRAINHLGQHQAYRSVDYGVKGTEFRYPAVLADTNVAVYTYDEENDTVEIYPAAQYAYNRAGAQLFYSEYNEDGTLKTNADNLSEKVTKTEYVKRYDLANAVKFADLADEWAVLKPVYAVDYVKLDISKDIGSKQVRYDMDKADASYNQYNMWDVYEGKYQGNYVNATHDTEYYVVNSTDRSSNIGYYVGYENLPKYAKEDIHAMYAVATNTTAALDKADYWVADVIVIEADNVMANFDSTALAYFNTRKDSADKVKHLDALNNMTEDPQTDLVPLKASWPGQWVGYGFYALYDTEVSEPEVAANKIELIEANFNARKIFAGAVYRDRTIWNRGDYVMIDNGDGYQHELFVGNAPVYGIADAKGSTDWDVYELTTADLATGDEIIYVYNNSGNTLKYIVVANFDGVNYDEPKDWYVGAQWVKDLWAAIIADQNPEDERGEVTISIYLDPNEVLTVTCEGEEYTIKGDADVDKPDDLTLKVTDTVEFKFTLDLAKVNSLYPNGDYKFTYRVTDGVATVTAIDTSKVTTLSVAAPVKVGTAFTAKAVNTIVTMATSTAITNEATKEFVDGLAKLLLEVKVGLIPDSANVAAVEEKVVDAVVTAKVNVIVAENPELDASDIAALEEAVKEALEEAEKTGELDVDKINDDIQDKLDQKVEEILTVNVKFAVEGDLTAMTVKVGDKVITGNTNGDYTIDKDTVLTVVLTSKVELDKDAPVSVTAGTAVVIPTKVDLSDDHKTVTVTLPATTADVTYKFVLKAAAAAEIE